MANTFKALSTVTVGAGGTAQVSFTNIPQTYTDLYVLISVRSERNTGGTDGINMRYNGVSASHTLRDLYGSGSGVQSENSTSSRLINYIEQDGGSVGWTANTFNNITAYIPNYTSNKRKFAATQGVTENNGTTSYQHGTSNATPNTEPVTTLDFVTSNGFDFTQYSTFTLYGVFNADVSSPPSTPTSLTATQGDARALVSFTEVSNAASYTVTSNPGSITATSDKSPILVTGLTNGTSYYFTATASNPFGTSSASSASNSVVPQLGQYESLASTTVGAGGTTAVTFSSISQDYTHLEIRCSLKSNRATSTNSVFVRFNGDSNNIYDYQFIETNGTAAGSGGVSNTSTMYMGEYPAANATSGNLFGIITFTIPNYTNTNKKRTIQSIAHETYDTVQPHGHVALYTGVYDSVSAISSITLTDGAGASFQQYSTFDLYGIRSL